MPREGKIDRKRSKRANKDLLSVVELQADSLAPGATLFERYYAIAEAMNGRGAMEMAVPFYRQAIALLLAESADKNSEVVPDADISGNIDAGLDLASFEARLHELEQDLSPENTEVLLAALEDLESQWLGEPQPELLGLRAKTLLLGRQLEKALAVFEQALELAPNEPALQINVGAARLALGDGRGAWQLLNKLYQQGIDQLEPRLQQALLRNLIKALELATECGSPVPLWLQLLQRSPDSQPLDLWMDWAQQSMASAATHDPLDLEAFLRALWQQFPAERKAPQLLAELLEDQGEYQQAALIYRDLLRPQLLER
jgi:tetratricopeptide (TPR) repeat protein